MKYPNGFRIFYLNFSSEFNCHYFDTEYKDGTSGNVYHLFTEKQISELIVWELKFREQIDAYEFIRENNIPYSVLENLKCPICGGFGRHCTQFVYDLPKEALEKLYGKK